MRAAGARWQRRPLWPPALAASDASSLAPGLPLAAAAALAQLRAGPRALADGSDFIRAPAQLRSKSKFHVSAKLGYLLMFVKDKIVAKIRAKVY